MGGRGAGEIVGEGVAVWGGSIGAGGLSEELGTNLDWEDVPLDDPGVGGAGAVAACAEVGICYTGRRDCAFRELAGDAAVVDVIDGVCGADICARAYQCLVCWSSATGSGSKKMMGY